MYHDTRIKEVEMKTKKTDLSNLNILEELNRKVQIEKKKKK